MEGLPGGKGKPESRPPSEIGVHQAAIRNRSAFITGDYPKKLDRATDR